MVDSERFTRRKLLQTTGLSAGVALAGCLGDGGDDGDNETQRGSQTSGADGDEQSDDTDSEEEYEPPEDPLPVLFVHGGSGSAAQFESQAMRFASNGYGQELLHVFEYNTSVDFGEIEQEVNANLEAKIGDVLDATGAEGINVIGHSRGTSVMHSYLSEESRAADVTSYVNVDGRPAESPPGGVRTLAVWGLREERRQIGGAENVRFDQTHVEVATGAQTFGEMYEFFRGEAPETTQIQPQPSEALTVAGRATIFPQNVGATGTLRLYEIDPATGQRRGEPVASADLTADGSWGPFEIDAEARYEYAIERSDGSVHHFYRPTPLRSNHFVRLETSQPGQGIEQLVEPSPDHAGFVIERDREWWGDQGENNDVLSVDGTNLVNEATAPRDEWTIAMIVFDSGSDGQSDVTTPIQDFEIVPFIRGIDLYVPAASPPNETVPIVAEPRGAAFQRELNVPNWASDDHRITVSLPDHTQQR